MYIYIFTALFIIADVVTGIIKGCYYKNINSTILRKGLYHKASELLSIIVAVLVEQAGHYIDLGIDIPFVNAVCTYICLMELISIIENLAEINPTVRKLFKPYFAKLKEKEGENDDAD